jgi:glucan 1,3-beta-glucosidase
MGLNLRLNPSIPIGYWSVPITSADTNYSTDPSPYIPGAWPYFIRALGWATKHGIYTIVDLHGAPGSQNGYDNSGHRTTPKWALDPDNVARTVDIVTFIAKEGGDDIAVIELLNEAAGWAGDSWASTIRQYWQDGYHAVRNAVGGRVKVMIGDAFLGVDVSTMGTLCLPVEVTLPTVLGELHELPRLSGCVYGLGM